MHAPNKSPNEKLLFVVMYIYFFLVREVRILGQNTDQDPWSEISRQLTASRALWEVLLTWNSFELRVFVFCDAESWALPGKVQMPHLGTSCIWKQINWKICTISVAHSQEFCFSPNLHVLLRWCKKPMNWKNRKRNHIEERFCCWSLFVWEQ